MADEKAIALDKLARALNKLRDTGLPLNDWQAGKKYKINYPVLHENKIYRCIEAHTASSTFDETKWEVVSNVDSGLKAWGENTLYKTGDIVIYNDKIYKCITANNDATFTPLNWVCLSATGEEDIGHITFGYKLQSGYLPLDGSVYNRADYADLINWVEDNSLWASTSTDYGKFGTGDGTTTFTTPNFKGKFIECDDGTNTGVYTSAGLPNIKGVVDTYTNDTSGIFSISGVSGAFDTVGSLTKMNVYNGADSNDTSGKIILDASRSNSIYSDSVNTVQPESIKLIPQIKYRKPNKSLPVKAVRRTLWEGSVGNFTGLSSSVQINLLDEFTPYDIIGFYIYANWGGAKRYLYREITKEQLLSLQNSDNDNNTVSFTWGYSNTDDYCDILRNSTSRQLICNINKQIITKVVGLKYINENQYSTEEQLIGTWIDGKPLYQKTLVKTGGVSTNVTYFNDELPNIDYLQKTSASFITNINRYESEYINDSNDKLQVLVNVNSNNVGGVYTLFALRTVSEMYVTVQYTKTTN